jgi:CLIP-associating protein 1/2
MARQLAEDEDQEPEAILLGTDLVAPKSVYSEKELAKTFEELLVVLENKGHDFWNNRCEALRTIRALVLGGAAEYEGFMPGLHSLKVPFADAIADLRSTLVREACVTAALLSQTFGTGFAHMAETLVPAMLKQVSVVQGC